MSKVSIYLCNVWRYNGYRHHGCVNMNGASRCATEVTGELEPISWGQCNGYCPGIV